MRRGSILTAPLILLFICSLPTPVPAQGGRSPEKMFRWLDKNGNGTLDDEELRQFAPLRDFLENRGIDLSHPLSIDDFATQMGTFREKMLRRAEISEYSSLAEEEPPQAAPPFAGGFSGQRFASYSDDEGESDSGSSDSDKPEKKKTIPTPAKPRVSLSIKLPEEYRSKDKDGDGQIGLYEWSRRDLAAFRKLDRNGDGFLTPAELAAGPAKSTATSSSTATVSAATTSDSASPGGSAVATKPAGPPPAAGATGAASAAAELAFKFLDRDNNNSVSTEEWERSLGTRGRFERAGIKPTLPLSKDEFLKQFQQLK